MMARQAIPFMLLLTLISCMVLPSMADVTADEASPRGWLISAATKDEALAHSRLAVQRVQTSQHILRKWFDDFKLYYSKQYDSPEREAMAFQAFSDNMQGVLQINADPAETFWTSGNFFSDMTEQEFEATMLRVQAPDDMPDTSSSVVPDSVNGSGSQQQAVHEGNLGGRKMLLIGGAARQVDWRMSGKVSPVKYQGKCGACWAFAAVAAIESAYLIDQQLSYDKLSIDMSEQQLISCVKQAAGCDGGGAPAAFNYMVNNSLTTEPLYPFTSSKGGSGVCSTVPSNKSGIQLNRGVQWGPTRDEKALMDLVAKQPVVAYFKATSSFVKYAGGVYQNNNCGPGVNHAMLIVGYMWTGQVEGSAWIVKNSWGPWWGTSGYARIAMTGQGTPGTCGLNLFTTYPAMGGYKKTLNGR